MKTSFIEWRKLARRAGVGALLLLGLQAISADAHGVHQPASDGRVAQRTEDHPTLDWSLCLHSVGGTGSAIHCHTVAAAAPAIFPEWSPDPRDTVTDNGIVVALPHGAPSLLPRPRVHLTGPPAFILFTNFRS